MRSKQGWKIISIPHQLQSDQHQCGPWSHVALELFIEYFRKGKFDGFADCFTRHRLIRPLNLVAGTRSNQWRFREPQAANTAFICGVRDEMRRMLREADEQEFMPFRPVRWEMETLDADSKELAELKAQGGSTADAVDLDS